MTYTLAGLFLALLAHKRVSLCSDHMYAVATVITQMDDSGYRLCTSASNVYTERARGGGGWG